MVVAVVVLAGLLRTWKLSEWSLWEDEVITLIYVHHLDDPYISGFPLLFHVLKGLDRLPVETLLMGRVLAAVCGVVSIGLTYACFRSFVGRPAALLAMLLLTLNLGHLFWSQSARYYTGLLVLEVVASWAFLDGFERGRYTSLLLANLILFAALLLHLSAVLFLPVFAVYLLILKCRKDTGAFYDTPHLLAFGVPCLLNALFFAMTLYRYRWELQSWEAIPSARDPALILVKAVVYLGVPLLLLPPLALFLKNRSHGRVLLFLALAGGVPLLELVGIARTNVTDVTWYHAFGALLGLALLSGHSLVALHQCGRRRLALALGIGAVGYYLVFVAAYYTVMHGDRARWREATEYFRLQVDWAPGGSTHAIVHATAPRIVAYYLGADPATLELSGVRPLPEVPPTRGATNGEEWFLVAADAVPPTYVEWLEANCRLVHTLAARTGPRDRTIRVYRR